MSKTEKTAVTVKTAAAMAVPAVSRTTTKKIGGTTYEVVLHFSKTSTETISDKISRLIQRESFTDKAAMR
jgi:hypothetical protein